MLITISPKTSVPRNIYPLCRCREKLGINGAHSPLIHFDLKRRGNEVRPPHRLLGNPQQLKEPINFQPLGEVNTSIPAEDVGAKRPFQGEAGGAAGRIVSPPPGVSESIKVEERLENLGLQLKWFNSRGLSSDLFNWGG